MSLAKKMKPTANGEYNLTAYAVRVGDQWFAGFGGKLGQEVLTKFRFGLCNAKLVWDAGKAASYVKRLQQRGHDGVVVKVTT